MAHGHKFPVICLFRQGLAFHWGADLLHFPGLWSRFVCPFCSQEKSQGCEQYRFHQAFVPLIDYMDANVYGLGLQSPQRSIEGVKF
jgi:hypothetical protein